MLGLCGSVIHATSIDTQAPKNLGKAHLARELRGSVCKLSEAATAPVPSPPALAAAAAAPATGLPGPFAVMRGGSASASNSPSRDARSIATAVGPSNDLIQERLKSELARRAEEMDRLLLEASQRQLLIAELEREAFERDEELSLVRSSLAEVSASTNHAANGGSRCPSPEQAPVKKLQDDLRRRQAEEVELQNRLEALHAAVLEKQREVSSQAEATAEITNEVEGGLVEGALHQ
ncbi:unnamed protein product, partial [Polarella glacialis]